MYEEAPQQFLRNTCRQILVPTEVVIRDIFKPIQVYYSRAYWTHLFFAYDGLVPDEEQPVDQIRLQEAVERAGQKFRGTYTHAEPVYLLEVFEDWGDDGHTQYRLVGWALVKQSDLKADLYAEGDLTGVLGKIHENSRKR